MSRSRVTGAVSIQKSFFFIPRNNAHASTLLFCGAAHIRKSFRKIIKKMCAFCVRYEHVLVNGAIAFLCTLLGGGAEVCASMCVCHREATLFIA